MKSARCLYVVCVLSFVFAVPVSAQLLFICRYECKDDFTINASCSDVGAGAGTMRDCSVETDCHREDEFGPCVPHCHGVGPAGCMTSACLSKLNGRSTKSIKSPEPSLASLPPHTYMTLRRNYASMGGAN